MTTTDIPETRSPNRSERSLHILDSITLALLAVGAILMIMTTRRIDLQIMLMVAAGLMLGVSTIVSMHRRRTGYEPAIRGRPFGLRFLVRIAPSLMVLAAAIMSFAEKG